MVELLTVIAMIAVLAAILFPVFARAREQARTRSCMMNLVNIAVALRSYAHDHDGWYPPTEDDLLPLMPLYIYQEQGFMCPSARGYNSPGSIPMGAPADETRWHPPQPEGTMDPGMGMEGYPGPGEAVPPAMEGPPPPANHLPGVDLQPGEVIFAQGGGGPVWPAGTIMTAYYYRAGRRHNQTPLAPLCSDHEPRHNDRANVLFSDGAVKLISEGPWRELGFEKPEEISARRAEEQGAASVPGGFY